MSEKLIILCGISGSGKSTFATTTVQRNPEKYVIANRDKIRELLFGYTEESIHEYYNRNDINKLEKQVTKYEDTIIREGLAENKTVIVDATHLSREYLERFKFWNVPTHIEFFDIDINEAFKRLEDRVRKVDASIVNKQYDRYINLKKDLEKNPIDFTPTKIEKDESLYSCYIFDIDGTLAKMENRSPYEWNKVGEDKVVDWVSTVSKIIEEHIHIIICTGRDEICREDTKKWLEYNSITYTELHIRPKGDMRPDWIVKEEMWKDISTRYNILGLFDDRQQVVDRARNLSLKVFQVEHHNF